MSIPSHSRCWIWHGESDLNEVMHDDGDIKDDNAAAAPIEYDGIGSLLDDLHQDIHSNISMSTSASEGIMNTILMR